MNAAAPESDTSEAPQVEPGARKEGEDSRS